MQDLHHVELLGKIQQKQPICFWKILGERSYLDDIESLTSMWLK